MQINIFGCKIYISLLFLTLLTLILLLDKTGLMLFGFLAVIIHECGHLTIMIISKNKPREIILQPAGIIIRKADGYINSNISLFIAFGGVLFNLAAALFGGLIFYFTKSETAIFFSAAQTAVMLFNLLIIKGLDGYDILYLTLIRHFPEDTAKKICDVGSYVVITILLIGAVILLIFYGGNLSLLICAVYLLILALLNIRC